MKKLLIVLSVSLASVFANASYLYWQVDSADYVGMDGADQVTGARLVNGDSGALVTSYYLSYNDTTAEATWTVSNNDGSLGTLYAADIGSNTGSEYSYYIELVNSSGDVLGRSETPLVGGSNDFATYTNTGTTTSDLISVPTANFSAWHGSPYRAVPEPTSAILMLFGAAMLGLKRKNRSLN